MQNLITIDFETNPIEARPVYPPKPVGVSIKYRGKEPRYYAFGHPSKNNCTKEEAREAVRLAYAEGGPLLFHNAKFDTDVAEVHFGLPLPAWDRIHDTLYLLFLHDPHSRSLSLKPASERLLNMPPEERDAIRDWLVDMGIIKRTAAERDVGKNICLAPGDIVGPYANGDVVRTEKLFDLLLPLVTEAGMLKAYDRERRLMPILLQNEREGMNVDAVGLERDEKLYTRAQAVADEWLRKRLGAPTLNVDSNDEVADALESAGIVTKWVSTKTGKRSTAKKNMTVDLFQDEMVFTALGYRNRLGTCLSTFIRPWLQMAHSGGQIYTYWNQVRQAHGDENSGTRTGRMSCSPNFQNIPKDWFDKNDGFTPELFEAMQRKLVVPDLPMMRKYVLPDHGHSFGHRDYSQQEPRILAHFENDKLCARYNEDPDVDFHDLVRDEILAITGMELERRPVKILNLGMMYGMGIGKLAASMGVDVMTAKRIKAAQRRAIPGVSELEKEVRNRGKRGESVRTWGGRVYFCEPPALIGGVMKTFEYKLVNYLIQGSASDVTKEAIIRYHEVKKEGRFLVTVHDELNISAPKKAIKAEMLLLREAMESVELDVPMRCDAKIGPNWADIKDLKEKR